MTPNSPRPESVQTSRFILFLAVIYAALLVYGTLFPLSGWRAPSLSPWELMLGRGLRSISKPDLLTNLLIYAPLGYLAFLGLRHRLGTPGALTTAAAVGFFLSFGLEYLQAYLPGRVPSALDLLLNGVGALAGAALCALLRPQRPLGRLWQGWRTRTLNSGYVSDLGLLTLLLWALSQLTPLVPSLDVGTLRHGLKPLWFTLTAQQSLQPMQLASYAFMVVGLGMVARSLIRPSSGRQFLFFVAAVLLLKVPVIGRQLSAEALAGAVLGGIVLSLSPRGRPRRDAVLGSLALIGGLISIELMAIPGVEATPPLFNWVPFRGHLSNDLIGIVDILAGLWPFLALAYLVMTINRHPSRVQLIGGSVVLFAIVFALEWRQQFIPGRLGDITDAVIAASAWLLPWFHPGLHRSPPPPASQTQPDSIPARRRHRRRSRSPAKFLSYTALAAVLGSLGWWIAPSFQGGREPALDEDLLPRLPPPEALPAVSLPEFRHQHPRLPAPRPGDLKRLKEENPDYLRRRRKRADGGAGDLQSAITMAYLEPYSQDLNLLYRRLMELEFVSRGHNQGKPLAMGYDWLYDYWTDNQRRGLQDKLTEAGEYLIHRIRDKQRLSPYNVVLYNQPFQALIAVNLALYGDHPRGEPIMRFTHDYWKRRVLPVWQQIMGNNGGWHEGGEYVGIGIGEAVYQVPAMWRSATGEDLFSTTPGLRGFLDFLIHRTRPDGTYYRWGDGAFYTKDVPDRIPLAIEFGDKAAYSLNGRCPKRTIPTAWPWGPLSRPDLCDPSAIARRPLAYHFDGIGQLVARSDWSSDATYVTFKAGDHFWSHSNLDQGAFTIYKGGALAIDSGLYGSRYGSPHHMNYFYQTIAHNVVTVLDPKDRVAAPGRDGKPDRPYANDGGQRRIGSGWGIEAAPLDRQEWEEKHDYYHTASLEYVSQSYDLTLAVADLTPAYTNSLSGKGTFSHRTRRVETYARTFGYDRLDDVIVVHDRVVATKPDFSKRWLLHMQEPPRLTGFGFIAEVLPTTAPPRAGGRLEAHVLWPERRQILLVGGPGAEFYVDGHNYDDEGKIQQILARKPLAEPGSWRVEIHPQWEAYEDQFLVVLLPSLAQQRPAHKVRLLRDAQRLGCEIVGPTRTTQWWFDPAKDGPVVRIDESGIRHDVDARIPKLGRYNSRSD